ncbi:FIG00953225: hypothetical protein [hydrothermal vent metagenome]|uniref:DUF3015 domain-containing protein n=1 Tax=hydrothermal vent metagenome TaxID=652676 RepID=A0A3B0XBI5_9ZZZZ
MKKLIIGSALLLASSGAYAVAPGGPGCGWGNLLFDGQSGIVPHFAASTTNGTSGNNTFGMTSGTNGCSVDGKLSYAGRSMLASMMDEFSIDVAQGQGEALTAVAVVLGIKPEDRKQFAQLTHDNFNTLFPDQNVTADQVYDSLLLVMKSDETMAKYAI